METTLTNGTDVEEEEIYAQLTYKMSKKFIYIC